MATLPAPFPRIGAYLAKEQRALLVFLLVLGLVTGFGQLAGEMLEGETRAFDEHLTYLFRTGADHAVPIGPSWLPGAVIDVTALGSVTVLTLVTVFAIAFLLLRQRWRQAVLVATAIGGGAIASVVLKSFFARPRPELVPHLVEVNTLSFPSGHATNSAIVYLTLAMLLARGFEEWTLRLFVLGTAIALTITIGITRVYLGVHYPSDVLAGWTAGAAWALAMGLVASRLQRRHKIEPPEATADHAEG